MKGYERRLEQSKKDPDDTGYRPLHESAGVSCAARSRKKLTGKSNWFKKSRDPGPNGVQDEHEKKPTLFTAPTIQEQRREERRIKKQTKRKKREEQQTEIVTTNVMFVENTPHGELCARLQRTADRMAGIAGRRVKMVDKSGTNPLKSKSLGRSRM